MKKDKYNKLQFSRISFVKNMGLVSAFSLFSIMQLKSYFQPLIISIQCCFIIFHFSCSNITGGRTTPDAPKIINRESVVSTTPILLPDGNLVGFTSMPDGRTVSYETIDNGYTWSGPKPLCPVDSGLNSPPLAAVWGKDGRLHLFNLQFREGRKFLELHYCRSSEDGTIWEPSRKLVPDVFIGALFDAICLGSGRIIVPYHYRVRSKTPPTGSNIVTMIYSDDNGETWSQSRTRITAPCFDGYNGNNFGACEPRILVLKDRRIWMLIRTQAGFLYESFSSDDGKTWTEAKPSIFYSSNSPGCVIRLQDGRIAAFWNNCENTTPFNGHGVYTCRDALHAAISEDDGLTWQGFREVYLDPFRNDPPPLKGDRGTAYPRAVGSADGKVFLITGQGVDRQVQIIVDPDWICQTTHESDFSDSLKSWSVFKRFLDNGFVSRMPGCELITHPTNSEAKVLHICRSDDKRADVAEWNFPMGRSGSVSINLLLQHGFAGGAIDLADRYFQPTDDAAISECIFNIPIDENGQVGDSHIHMELGEWHKLVLNWDITEGNCVVIFNREEICSVPMNRNTHLGISYLLLRSTAKGIDKAGFLVESVQANISEAKTVLQGNPPEPIRPRKAYQQNH